MIHASAKTEHPVKQGLWGAFEVFVGTMCICTVTSLVIVVTGLWDSGLDGAPLTLAAFETVLGPVGTIIITVAIFLFSKGCYFEHQPDGQAEGRPDQALGKRAVG